jgi:hypothetical protein
MPGFWGRWRAPFFTRSRGTSLQRCARAPEDELRLRHSFSAADPGRAAGRPRPRRGLHALCRIVNHRVVKAGVTPQEFCPDSTVLEGLCRAYGGHIRTLFVLLASAMDRCDELPVTRAVVERTIRRQAIDLSLSLRPAHWDALRKIHASKAELADNPDLWNALIRNLLAFAYEDESGVWYDWNALLAAVPGVAK